LTIWKSLRMNPEGTSAGGGEGPGVVPAEAAAAMLVLGLLRIVVATEGELVPTAAADTTVVLVPT